MAKTQLNKARLWLRFHTASSEQVDWLLLDKDGTIISGATSLALTELPKIAIDTEIIVFVPSSAVFFTSAILPQIASSRLLQTVPYTVEEQLATEIENLHFAIGKPAAGNNFPIIGIDKIQFEAWLAQLKAQQLTPTFITPDVFALPYAENSWSILIENTTTLIRTGAQLGCISDTESLNELLPMLLAEQAIPPEHFFIWGETKGIKVDLSKSEVQLHKAPENFLSFAAEFFEPEYSINLLQGVYRSKRKIGKIKKNWRVNIALLIILIGFFIVAHVAEYFYLQMQQADLQQQVNAARSLVNNPAETVTHSLRNIARIEKGNTFLHLLGQVGAALQMNNQVQLEEFEYQNNQLRFVVTLNNGADLDGVTKNLIAQKLRLVQTTILPNKNVAITVTKS